MYVCMYVSGMSRDNKVWHHAIDRFVEMKVLHFICVYVYACVCINRHASIYIYTYIHTYIMHA